MLERANGRILVNLGRSAIPMRVAHLITRLILGGAQENTLYTCEDLARRFGDEVILVTGPAEGPEGDLFERARRGGLDVRLVPSLQRALHPWRDLESLRALKKVIAAFRPDVVHTHSSKAGILGRWAAKAKGVPAIVHTIHGLPFHPYETWLRNRIYIAAERRAARYTDRFIAVADAMIGQAVEAGVAPRERFVTIHSGMEVEPFLNPPRDRETVRGELGVAPGEILVGKVARLFELKGHDDVIDAARQLVPQNPGLKFLFVGGGVWRERLEAKIRAVGLEGRFVFTGLVPSDRIPELLGAVDIVVHASYREGLARVLPQALIAARPVVSYNVDGAREVVLPGRTGYLVAAGDVAGLAEDLKKLIDDPEKRQAFGRTGRELFTDQFRHEAMTERIRAVYTEVLRSKGRA